MASSKLQEFIEETENKEILRFVTIGSVDDGKSTLIGRLLHDTNAVYEDQLSAVKSASTQNVDQGEIDFALITDGLKAEREQGITIDVAYRYFATKKRKFIIADTPGHVQYTRNMATGASTADVALILIDARHGVLPQTRRHAYISSLLGIYGLLVCVNKMDLKDYDEAVFEKIKKDMEAVTANMGFGDIQFIPVSALKGDNVVTSSANTPWYKGPTVLEYLETIQVPKDDLASHFALPVQLVIRPHLNFRGFAGRIISGSIQVADEIMVLPSEKTSRVKEILLYKENLHEAVAGQSIVLTLEDEIDISRGDMLVHPNHSFTISNRFRAKMVWLDENPLKLNRQYYLKHTTNSAVGVVNQVNQILNIESLQFESSDKPLKLNDIAEVTITVNRPLIADLYRNNRQAGAFILIDRITNQTSGAGMIAEFLDDLSAEQEEEFLEKVSREEKEARLNQKGYLVQVVAPTEQEAFQKAVSLERLLFDRGYFPIFIEKEDIAQKLLPFAKENALLILIPKVGKKLAIQIEDKEVKIKHLADALSVIQKEIEK